MNDDTAEKLLAIMERHDDISEGWSTAPEDRLDLYLSARAILRNLAQNVGEWLTGLTEPSDCEELQAVAAVVNDAANIASLLDEVERSAQPYAQPVSWAQPLSDMGRQAVEVATALVSKGEGREGESCTRHGRLRAGLRTVGRRRPGVPGGAGPAGHRPDWTQAL